MSSAAPRLADPGASNPERVELLVIGAGPAGLAAAAEASAAGVETLVIDSTAATGGQYYARPSGSAHFDGLPEEVVGGLREDRVEVRLGTSAWGVFGDRVALIDSRRSYVVEPSAVVLATGGYERPLPFPGWDLPGVVAPGGIQRLLKVSRVVPQGRIVIAGSGPFLLAVAADLRAVGADVVAVAESRSRRQLLGMVPEIARSRRQRRESLRMLRSLRGVSLRFGSGVERVSDGALILEGGERIEADLICVGHGFSPRLDLASAFGLRVEAGSVAVDKALATSREGLFAAGEATGIGGVVVAALEGRIAGRAAAQRLGGVQGESRLVGLRRELAGPARFAARLERTYPAPAVLSKATPETTICRCEQVALASLTLATERPAAALDPRAIKAELRCGMGPCQGVVCQESVRAATGWQGESDLGHMPKVRPPLSFVTVGALARADEIGD